MNTKIKQGICGVCPGGCQVEVEIENGKISDVKPLKGARFSSLCLRGKHSKDVVYSNDRIKKPLIRSGEKGEGKFRESSWEEALDYIGKSIKDISKKYGPESVMSHTGRGVFEHSARDFLTGPTAGIFEPLGSPNMASVGSVCYNSFGVIAPMTTYGIMGARLTPDIENTNLLVVWGANPSTDSPQFTFKRVLKAKEKGTRIIAIDHYKSDIAKRADKYIPVRSGTDGALILSIIKIIIDEKLYDIDFVENYTYGFKELVDYVQEFTLDRVSKITGIEKEDIYSLAREIATANNAAIVTYTGLEYSNCGVQCIRALYILWALTGNLDVKGGLLISPKANPTIKEFKCEKPRVKPIGADKYPLFYELVGGAHFMEFPNAVLNGDPYKIKALLNIGSSILTSYPNPEKYEEALRELDFLCVVDRFMTKDALYADVVLPSTTHYEDESYVTYPGLILKRERIIEPIGEARNDLYILHEIAKRLGYGKLYPRDENELFEMAFAKAPNIIRALNENPNGFELPKPEIHYKKYQSGKLREDGKSGFDTPSGKLEIKSQLLKSYGYDGLPKYVEPIESPISTPDVHKEYPLVLNTGARIQNTFRSQHLNIPGLLKYQPNPEVMISLDEAKRRSIEDGDKVLVKTKYGEVVFYANVSSDMKNGGVEVNMGGGNPTQKKSWRLANTNKLINIDNRDPISGFPVYKALLCEVKKWKEAEK
ncbi:molybdopterin-containing oxidoreductase family protein [Clostridium cylindrosporum]|uniref:Acetylene hydratase n=1 Tax=Clostridium cylindrosporum DSM 605 TaxID=1121307 RepID=A0A0J8DDE1_CLOCY|nr:molybdopterin-dependent oxidoreductase [Clostridium cylindrosporum]KMT22253.1 acetylene hydratase [Clostridium cylindrosporum DSM 605]